MIGGGIALRRMWLLSMGSLGQGVTDVVFSFFLVDSLRTLGASRFAALMALGAGAALSIVSAPLVGALGGRSVKLRKYTTVSCFTVAAIAAVAVAFLVGNHSPGVDGERERDVMRIILVTVAAAVYRAATQSAPIVPMCIDAASVKVKGDSETADRRVAISLSCFYLNYRAGFLIINIVLATLPLRTVDRLLPVLGVSTLFFILTIGVTAVAMPSGLLEPQDEEVAAAKPPPVVHESVFKVALKDIKRTLVTGDVRLKLMYLTTLLYGVAFGQLAGVTAPFYNEVVFNQPPGAAKGIEWAAYSGLIAWAVGLLHDGLIGGIAFAAPLSTFGMTVFWVLEFWIGVGFFVWLFFSSHKTVALVVFGLLAISQSAQNFFSLVAGGALVAEPKLRPTAFGIRAAALQTGFLIGNIIAAFVLEREDSFKPVMLLSAVALGLASIPALFIGTVERPEFTGVATNANPLFNYAAGGFDRKEVS